MIRQKNKKSEDQRSLQSIVARVVLVVVALAACAVLPVFLNSVVGYLPLLVLVLVIALSFAYLQVLKRSLTFSEDSLVPSCERGTDIEFVINFENKSPLLFTRIEPSIYISDLFGNVDTVSKVSMPLMPHEKRDFSFDARFDHIGRYSAGVKRIVIYDLLGLFTYTIENPKRHEVEVLPRLYDLEDLPLSSVASSDSERPRQALVTDDLDYAGVREYILGDPIKTIHWKLSSRLDTGNYLTRLFEAFTNPAISIVLDTSSPEYDSEDLMSIYDTIVESALSVNQFALASGVDARLVFRDNDGEDAQMRLSSPLEFEKLVTQLPRIHPGSNDDAFELLCHEGNATHGPDNVALCTAHVSQEVITFMTTLRLRKRNPLLFVAVPPSMEDEEARAFSKPLQLLDDAQVPYYVLSSTKRLVKEVRR